VLWCKKTLSRDSLERGAPDAAMEGNRRFTITQDLVHSCGQDVAALREVTGDSTDEGMHAPRSPTIGSTTVFTTMGLLCFGRP